ncbi:MAG: PAS domain-containing protein [Hyphomicrobium sp.]
MPVEEAVELRMQTLLSPVPLTTERNEVHRQGAGDPLRASGGRWPPQHVSRRDGPQAAENELKRVNSTLQAFIKHAPAAVAMFDTDMQYIAYTDRWLHDYGLDDQSLIGRSHYDVFPEVPDHWREKHRRILAGATETCSEEAFQSRRRLDQRHPVGGAPLAPRRQQRRRHDDADRGDIRA